MPNYADKWTPNGPFGIVEDTDTEGGFRVVANAAERNAIPLLRQKAGMWILQQDTRVLYRIQTVGEPPTCQEIMSFPVAAVGGLFQVGARVYIDGTSGAIYIDTDSGDATDGLGILDVADNTIGGIMRPRGAAFVKAIGIVAASRVVSGCYLKPGIQALGGGNSGPAVAVSAGQWLTASGRPVSTGALTADETSLIGGGSFPAGPGYIYAFLRKKGGVDTAVVRLSTNPPDVLGQPSAADATYVVSDYCYVGFLRYLLDTSPSGYAGVWGNSAVIHHGNGVREVIFDPTDSGLDSTATATNLDSGITTTVSPTSPFGAGPGVGICGEVDVIVSWEGLGVETTGARVRAFAVNMEDEVYEVGEHFIRTRARWPHELDNNPISPAVTITGLGTYAVPNNFVAVLRLISMTENVNAVEEVQA